MSMFGIYSTFKPLVILHKGETRHKAWREFYEACNVMADNQREFVVWAGMKGFKSKQLTKGNDNG